MKKPRQKEQRPQQAVDYRQHLRLEPHGRRQLRIGKEPVGGPHSEIRRLIAERDVARLGEEGDAVGLQVVEELFGLLFGIIFIREPVEFPGEGGVLEQPPAQLQPVQPVSLGFSVS